MGNPSATNTANGSSKRITGVYSCIAHRYIHTTIHSLSFYTVHTKRASNEHNLNTFRAPFVTTLTMYNTSQRLGNHTVCMKEDTSLHGWYIMHNQYITLSSFKRPLELVWYCHDSFNPCKTFQRCDFIHQLYFLPGVSFADRDLHLHKWRPSLLTYVGVTCGPFY